MASAMDSRLAYARPSAVATASRLPTATRGSNNSYTTSWDTTLALGEGLPIIGRLLGHRRIETTARYAHLARDSVRESAERIAVSIAADIL